MIPHMAEAEVTKLTYELIFRCVGGRGGSLWWERWERCSLEGEEDGKGTGTDRVQPHLQVGGGRENTGRGSLECDGGKRSRLGGAYFRPFAHRANPPSTSTPRNVHKLLMDSHQRIPLLHRLIDDEGVFRELFARRVLGRG